VQTILVKVNLFLVVGLIDRRAGTSRLSELGGLSRSAPLIAAFFALPALSLAGLPPSSGFAGKFSLIGAGVGAEEWTIVVVALVVGLLTLFSMTKVWAGAFWGDPVAAGDANAPSRITVSEPLRVPGPLGSTLTVGSTAIVVALSIGYVILAGPIYGLCERAAEQLLDPQIYIDAVLGGGR
jgi:multicomponent Na+:H+ antiporter subunit D